MIIFWSASDDSTLAGGNSSDTSSDVSSSGTNKKGKGELLAWETMVEGITRTHKLRWDISNFQFRSMRKSKIAQVTISIMFILLSFYLKINDERRNSTFFETLYLDETCRRYDKTRKFWSQLPTNCKVMQFILFLLLIAWNVYLKLNVAITKNKSIDKKCQPYL